MEKEPLVKPVIRSTPFFPSSSSSLLPSSAVLVCYVRCCRTILCLVFVPLLLLLLFLYIFSSRYCLLRHHKHRKQKKSFFSLRSLFLRQKLDNCVASRCFFFCFFASHRSPHPFCNPVKIAPRSKQPINFGHQKKSGSLSPEASPREFSCPFPPILFFVVVVNVLFAPVFLRLCFVGVICLFFT